MRRWFWVLLLIVAFLAAGDALLWRYASRQLRAGLDQWVAAQRAAGWKVSMAGQQTGGWPLAATLAVRDVSVEGGRGLLSQDASWRADRVVLRLSLLHPASLRIDASGQGHLRVGAAPEVGYSSKQLTVAVPLWSREPPVTWSTQADGLAIDLPEQRVTVEALSAEVTVSPAAKQAEPGIAVALDAKGVGLPPGMHWALGPRVASMTLDAVLDGPLPTEGGLTQRATTWRNDGGALEVHRLDTAWGPLASACERRGWGWMPTCSRPARRRPHRRL